MRYQYIENDPWWAEYAPAIGLILAPLFVFTLVWLIEYINDYTFLEFIIKAITKVVSTVWNGLGYMLSRLW